MNKWKIMLYGSRCLTVLLLISAAFVFFVGMWDTDYFNLVEKSVEAAALVYGAFAAMSVVIIFYALLNFISIDVNEDDSPK